MVVESDVESDVESVMCGVHTSYYKILLLICVHIFMYKLEYR